MTRGEPKSTNRLVHESSPYLLQHAHNPVDWYPWGDEAFRVARTTDRPIFLSIGYSTCHWCHVMEHESFDDEQIAAYLNEHFVSIKVDREQRPDVDDIYMTGVQMLTGQGGWPMSSFLTTEAKPFFAGTYFPPANFLALLREIDRVWREQRVEVEKQAQQIADGIARFTGARAEAKTLAGDLFAAAATEVLERHDTQRGGFGSAPKFPNEVLLELLLEGWARKRDRAALDALTLTLDKMYQGGIHDHLGGGFHRYSVDGEWLVPHFEKMLYNQAQLLRVYSRAAALAGHDAWRRVALGIVRHVLRDMRSPDGLFYSATDADSEGEEGRFFVWTPEEIDTALPDDDITMAQDFYNVSTQGNFEGRNILHPGMSFEAAADKHGLAVRDFLAWLDRINERLLETRGQRIHPLRDDKVITAWNAMMITALATAGFELGEREALDAAKRGADVLWQHAFDGDRLWRITMGGERSIAANLEDYSFFADALLTLFAITGDARYRVRGERLVADIQSRFEDTAEGGFFLSAEDADGPLITRPKSPMDGATASANSATMHALVKLWRLSHDVGLEASINRTINAFAGLIDTSPSAFASMVLAITDFTEGQSGDVQFAGGDAVRVVLIRREEGVSLKMIIRAGWHVNAAAVSDDDLIPTRVEAGGGSVVYPDDGTEAWEGEKRIDIHGDVDTLGLTLQPCSGDLCLAAETLVFAVR